MRTFSDFEKQMMRVLAEEEKIIPDTLGEGYKINQTIDYIMTEYLKVISIEPIKDDDSIKIHFRRKTESKNEEEFDRSYINNLFEFIYLLKYLENNYLLGIDPFGSENEFNSERYICHNGLFFHKTPETISIADKGKEKGMALAEMIAMLKEHPVESYAVTSYTSLAEDILEYANSKYHPTQQLRYIVENDFKSFEWQNIEKQTKLARWTFIGSVIALCLSILTTLIFPLIIPRCSELNKSTSVSPTEELVIKGGDDQALLPIEIEVEEH